MIRTLLKSKLHRATVTEANLDYEGSITIDADLLAEADIRPYEQVSIYDVTSGARLTTYAIEGEPGSGEFCVNGAAAHLVHPGDKIIVCSYAQFDEAEVRRHRPRVLLLGEDNRVVEKSDSIRAGAVYGGSR